MIAIEAAMLWPGDEDHSSRTEAELTATVELFIAQARAGAPIGKQDNAILLAESAGRATPLASLHQRTRELNGGPFIRGFLAGQVLALAIERAEARSPDARMKSVIHDVSKDYAMLWSIAAKTIENKVWPIYRPVSHLWAASVAINHATGATAFPCAAINLRLFLVLAEAYRETGERIRLKQAPGPILPPGEAARFEMLEAIDKK